MVKKVLFIGRPAMGKTTIIKVLFENEDPNILALFPLESTLGKKFSIYNFLDLKLSVLDTAGQSLPSYFINNDLQDTIFGDTSKIIYLFDYDIWVSNSEMIVDDIKLIYEINERKDYGSDIALFLHKIDLIPQITNKMLVSLEREIIDKLNLPVKLGIYFTSIQPQYIYSIFNAFYNVLSNLSLIISNMENIIDEFFKDLSNSICFITDNKNHILSQIMTEDFDLNLLREFQDKIHNTLTDNINQDIIKTFPKILEINSNFFFNVISDISSNSNIFKNIIIFSQNLNNAQLQDLIIDLKEKLINYTKTTK